MAVVPKNHTSGKLPKRIDLEPVETVHEAKVDKTYNQREPATCAETHDEVNAERGEVGSPIGILHQPLNDSLQICLFLS